MIHDLGPAQAPIPTRPLGFLPADATSSIFDNLDWTWIVGGAAALVLIAWVLSDHSSSPIRQMRSRRVIRRLKEAS